MITPEKNSKLFLDGNSMKLKLDLSPIENHYDVFEKRKF